MGYSKRLYDLRKAATADITKYVERKGPTTIKNLGFKNLTLITLEKGLLVFDFFTGADSIPDMQISIIADMLNQMPG